MIFAIAIVVLVGSCSAKSRWDELNGPNSEATRKEEELNRTIAVLAGQAASSSAEYIIGPEDGLEITLFDLENVNGEPRIVEAHVSTSGYVTLPYIGQALAAGYTPLEFEETLRKAYLRFIHDPQLSVLVRQYRSYSVSVLGLVNVPGVLQLQGRKTLLEAIALAGGLAEGAGSNVRLTRVTPIGAETVLIDLDRIAEKGEISLNVPVLPNDVVSVPKAGMFYVEGVVKTPGAYPLLVKTMVSQAVATAGGADRALADLSGTMLYRKSEEGGRVAIPINLARLGRNPSEDFLVQEEDVIVVPISGPKMVWDRFTGGILRVGVSAGSF